MCFVAVGATGLVGAAASARSCANAPTSLDATVARTTTRARYATSTDMTSCLGGTAYSKQPRTENRSPRPHQSLVALVQIETIEALGYASILNKDARTSTALCERGPRTIIGEDEAC